MKKNLLLVSFFAATLFVGCKSQEVETTPEEVIVEEVITEEPVIEEKATEETTAAEPKKTTTSTKTTTKEKVVLETENMKTDAQTSRDKIKDSKVSKEIQETKVVIEEVKADSRIKRSSEK